MERNSNKKLYTCPMHPEIVQENAGLCPECGMNLIPVANASARKHTKLELESKDLECCHASYNKHSEMNKPAFGDSAGRHEGHSTNIFKAKFWASLILSVPIVVYSDTIQKLLGFKAPVFSGSEYLQFTLSSVVFFYGGWVFIVSAYRELKAKLPGMMTLIALAISVAYSYSVAVTFFGGGDNLFWELTTLITIML
ncbi:MAG: heavy metal-binding domain-containing protein, partial [Patescibacteria group bacterium]